MQSSGIFIHKKIFLYVAIVILFISSIISLLTGVIEITIPTIIDTVFGKSDMQTNIVLIDIRLSRIILGLLVGASLGIAGAALQGLFRNGLADPGLIGISSGAALGAILVIVLGGSALSGWVIFFDYFAIPAAAFLASVLVTWLIYRLATKSGVTDVSLMLLAGIAINVIVTAIIGILTYYASDNELRDLTFWTMGSIANGSWQGVLTISIPIIITIVVLPFFARGLNAFLMGEAVAKHMGVNVKQLKIIIVIFSSIAVGSATAITGIIGFVGLVAPHLARLSLGPDNRFVMPSSALIGAILVILSDIVARTIIMPAEMPIGIIMSALGGPFFLYLLLHQKTRYKR